MSVAISPDGHTALSGSADSSLKLWELGSGSPIRTLTGHAWAVSSVAISPDGRTALSSSYDDTVRLWDLANGNTIRTFFWKIEQQPPLSPPPTPDEQQKLTLARFVENDARSIAFVPDGRTALSGGRKLRQWDLASGSAIRTDNFYNAIRVTSVAIARDGHTALSGGSSNELNLWDLGANGPIPSIRRFDGHASGVASVAIAPDGRTGLSGSDDHTLKLWDLT